MLLFLSQFESLVDHCGSLGAISHRFIYLFIYLQTILLTYYYKKCDWTKCFFFRSRLSVIPQEPFLFCGTVKENIDPLNEYHEAELMQAIQRCHLTSAINRMGGLGAHVLHGGRNLSMGQRQLLCLVRAVLHNAKVSQQNSHYSNSSTTLEHI